MTWVGAPRAATYARQEFAVPGPFLVILATLSAPSIASATMCSMCRCGVACSENVRDACRTPPDARHCHFDLMRNERSRYSRGRWLPDLAK